MYVLIDESYPDSYRAVQAGHAVAAWLLKYPDGGWYNNTLVYLRVPDLEFWKQKLVLYKKCFASFVEPDVGYKTTAIALLDDGKLFRKLRLN